LKGEGYAPLIAPGVPYGVTECAAAFKGAVSVPAGMLRAFLTSVVDGYLANDVAHVCLINNHLEPGHVAAVREAIKDVEPGRASVACPLEKRWARTLSDEFKSGAAHAGCYETSIILAADPELVDDDVRAKLPDVPVSLSDKLRAGVTDFVEMGLSRAYAGSPADATAAHGDDQLGRLATMIASGIIEAMGRASKS
jgi:creatinine amidohydrolase